MRSRSRRRRPSLVLLAGPNGAGKTTVLPKLDLPAGLIFVQQDGVAERLRDEHGYSLLRSNLEAGRQVLRLIERLIARKAPFLHETNLAGGFHRKLLRRPDVDGVYEPSMYFLALRSPDLAVERVALRVSQGGHTVPERDVRRKWRRGLELFFETYSSIVPDWTMLDVSLFPVVMVAQRRAGGEIEVHHAEKWSMYARLANDDG